MSLPAYLTESQFVAWLWSAARTTETIAERAPYGVDARMVSTVMTTNDAALISSCGHHRCRFYI